MLGQLIQVKALTFKRKQRLPLPVTVFADRLQVVHGLPLIEAEAIRLDVMVVMLGPLQPTARDHSCLYCTLAAAVQHLQHRPYSSRDGGDYKKKMSGGGYRSEEGIYLKV